jgi:hypothetical protein
MNQRCRRHCQPPAAPRTHHGASLPSLIKLPRSSTSSASCPSLPRRRNPSRPRRR